VAIRKQGTTGKTKPNLARVDLPLGIMSLSNEEEFASAEESNEDDDFEDMGTDRLRER
jgi:hypothetical protein